MKQTNSQKLFALVQSNELTEKSYKATAKLLKGSDNGLHPTYSKWLHSRLTIAADENPLEQAAFERMRVFNEKDKVVPYMLFVNALTTKFAMICKVTENNGEGATKVKRFGLLSATKARKAAEDFAMETEYLNCSRIEIRSETFNENFIKDSEGRNRWVGMDWVEGDKNKRRDLDVEYTRAQSIKKHEALMRKLHKDEYGY